MEYPICFLMQCSGKWASKYRIRVTLEPKSKKITHFWKEQHTLIYPIVYKLQHMYLAFPIKMKMFLFNIWQEPFQEGPAPKQTRTRLRLKKPQPVSTYTWVQDRRLWPACRQIEIGWMAMPAN